MAARDKQVAWPGDAAAGAVAAAAYAAAAWAGSLGVPREEHARQEGDEPPAELVIGVLDCGGEGVFAAYCPELALRGGEVLNR